MGGARFAFVSSRVYKAVRTRQCGHVDCMHDTRVHAMTASTCHVPAAASERSAACCSSEVSSVSAPAADVCQEQKHIDCIKIWTMHACAGLYERPHSRHVTLHTNCRQTTVYVSMCGDLQNACQNVNMLTVVACVSLLLLLHGDSVLQVVAPLTVLVQHIQHHLGHAHRICQ